MNELNPTPSQGSQARRPPPSIEKLPPLGQLVIPDRSLVLGYKWDELRKLRETLEKAQYELQLMRGSLGRDLGLPPDTWEDGARPQLPRDIMGEFLNRKFRDYPSQKETLRRIGLDFQCSQELLKQVNQGLEDLQLAQDPRTWKGIKLPANRPPEWRNARVKEIEKFASTLNPLIGSLALDQSRRNFERMLNEIPVATLNAVTLTTMFSSVNDLVNQSPVMWGITFLTLGKGAGVGRLAGMIGGFLEKKVVALGARAAENEISIEAEATFVNFAKRFLNRNRVALGTLQSSDWQSAINKAVADIDFRSWELLDKLAERNGGKIGKVPIPTDPSELTGVMMRATSLREDAQALREMITILRKEIGTGAIESAFSHELIQKELTFFKGLAKSATKIQDQTQAARIIGGELSPELVRDVGQTIDRFMVEIQSQTAKELTDPKALHSFEVAVDFMHQAFAKNDWHAAYEIALDLEARVVHHQWVTAILEHVLRP